MNLQKIKLSISEKFLWDLYHLFEFVDDVSSTLFLQPMTIKRAVCPEFYEIKRIYEKKKRKKDFTRMIYYLKRRGWIKVKELEEKRGIIFTLKGKEKLLKIKNKILTSLPKKKREDGKWIMVAFDIEEKKRALRNYFREKLIEFGFQKFQESIWICPYDVLKEVKEIIQNLKIEKMVKIFLIEEKEI